MIKWVTAFVKGVDLLNERVGSIVVWGGPLLVGILLIEAVYRYVLHIPNIWSVELLAFVFLGYFLLGGGYTLLHKGHVSMDALYDRWTQRRRAVFDIATFPLFVIYLGATIWICTGRVIYALEFNLHSPTFWGPPMVPIRIIIVIGVSLLFLQGLADFIRSLSIVFRRRDLE